MGIFGVIAIIFLIGWVVGLLFKIAGGFIHVLLVLAVIMFIINLLKRQ